MTSGQEIERLPEADHTAQAESAKSESKIAPRPATRISVQIWQPHPPPVDQYWAGVGIGVGDEGTVVSSRVAWGLALAINDRDPELAARLREASDEVSSRTGSRNDPGDEVEEAQDSPERTALVYRLLGIDPPAAE